MIPYCNAHGIGLIPWAPLAAGHLARPLNTETTRVDAARGGIFEVKHSEADVKIITRVEEIAKKHGWTMGQVALAWIGKKVSSPIVGVSSVSHGISSPFRC
jgi:aryl-alcohol dehydrogenase-like predicted oxidoreductase